VIRVLIADDHAPTRADVRAAIERGGFAVCAEAPDAAAAIEAALRERPAVCLLDIRMPGGGIAAAWEITARLPAVKVVMLTVSDDDYDLFAALRAGASGYLLKATPLEALPAALHSVLAGEAVLSPALVSRIVEEFRDRAPRRRRLVQLSADAQLTSREWEVLDLLRHHFTTTQIARRLYVSPATVRSHVAAVLRKLRVPDRDAAIRLFEAS
jgi:DNA-binding NarL/FixJ family response regulator